MFRNRAKHRAFQGATRRRFKQLQPLEERLMDEAKRLRDEAKKLPLGREREKKLRKARYDETAAQLAEWLTSPGLRSPV
nr:hypothetical protein [Bradyrhizobium elkanii]